MAGFIKKRSYLKNSPVAQDALIIDNSITVTIGDLVKTAATDACALATAGAKMFGVATGFRTNPDGVVFGEARGIELENADSGPDYDGTFTSGGVDVGAYAAAGDNLTDKKILAVIDVDPYGIYSNTPDATIGTTVGSNKRGYYTDIADEDQVDENNAGSLSLTTVAGMLTFGLDPELSSAGLYMIVEWIQFGNGPLT